MWLQGGSEPQWLLAFCHQLRLLMLLQVGGETKSQLLLVLFSMFSLFFLSSFKYMRASSFAQLPALTDDSLSLLNTQPLVHSERK